MVLMLWSILPAWSNLFISPHRLRSAETFCHCYFALPSVIKTKKIDSFSGNKYLYLSFFEQVILITQAQENPFKFASAKVNELIRENVHIDGLCTALLNIDTRSHNVNYNRLLYGPKVTT